MSHELQNYFQTANNWESRMYWNHEASMRIQCWGTMYSKLKGQKDSDWKYAKNKIYMTKGKSGLALFRRWIGKIDI